MEQVFALRKARIEPDQLRAGVEAGGGVFLGLLVVVFERGVFPGVGLCRQILEGVADGFVGGQARGGELVHIGDPFAVKAFHLSILFVYDHFSPCNADSPVVLVETLVGDPQFIGFRFFQFEFIVGGESEGRAVIFDQFLGGERLFGLDSKPAGAGFGIEWRVGKLVFMGIITLRRLEV